MPPTHILLCTLGASWAVIPEILGWLAPDVLDLYAHHPQRQTLDALRTSYQLQAPDELWICTTEGRQAEASLAGLRDWWQRLGTPMPLRVWTAAGTDQLASQAECDHIRELTLRVVLLASERIGAGQLVLSLAGGRKTMSADLQSAGTVFGAAAWLHVVGPDPMPGALLGRTPTERAALPALFAAPLAAELAQAITPLVAGAGRRNELLDVAIDGQRIDSTAFPLPLAEPGARTAWPMPVDGPRLQHEISRRQREGSQLLGNYLAQLARSERHDNWRSLYRLPPATIEALRATPLTDAHTAWLTDLPKADLHRHLGGCLDVAAQQRVARAIWAALDDATRTRRSHEVAALLVQPTWPWDWPASLRGRRLTDCRPVDRSDAAIDAEADGRTQDPIDAPAARCERTAAVLLLASAEQLAHNLFGVTAPRVALKHHVHGFAAYERPGELSGSALLGHPAAIAPYAQALVAQTRAEGLAYVELRGSPHKYRPHDPAGFLNGLRAALQAAGAITSPGDPAGPDDAASAIAPRIGFVWILDRRQRAGMAAVVAQAVAAHAQSEGFLLGLDLAGDEGTHDPAALAPAFEPAFAQCLPLTIHAGEGESADHIWQAAYHLHADRIGHGLSLAQHPQLAARFRDRGICLELCPSSNREVVGFHDPLLPSTQGLPPYPLRAFIDAGLPVTLCTDNPGISRTTLAGEYLAAARMTSGGLSLWEALALMRQAFVHAFIGSDERERLLKTIDQHIFRKLAAPGALDISSHHRAP